MIKKSDYSEKLKDPRWQKKRLQVFNRDEFKCTLCGDDKTTLHVHHEKYQGNPWEVDLIHLKTLCSDCHFITHHLESLNQYNFKILKVLKILNEDYINIILIGKEKTITTVIINNKVTLGLISKNSFFKNVSDEIKKLKNG